MDCFRRIAPVLLLHISLLLALIAGAGLATAARLKWDPSTYIVVRGLFPKEYRVGAPMLCVSASTLIVLGHFAAIILITKAHLRRVLLLMYAFLMTMVMCVESVWAVWMCIRVMMWLQTPQAANILIALQMGKELDPISKVILDWMSSIIPLTGKIKRLIEEAEEDIPNNFYVGVGAIVFVVMLQFIAILLAIYCALRTSHARNPQLPVMRRFVPT